MLELQECMRRILEGTENCALCALSTADDKLRVEVPDVVFSMVDVVKACAVCCCMLEAVEVWLEMILKVLKGLFYMLGVVDDVGMCPRRADDHVL